MASNCRHLLWLLLAALAVDSPLKAQSDQPQWLDVEFPRDSPVSPISFSLRPSSARSSGATTVLELHASLLLRNTATKTISGITLRIEAQDLTPVGKASVSVPSLHVQQGESFPLRLDLELRRPQSGSSGNQGAVVRVTLDCALFKDFTSFGPDTLNSRRSLTVYELQARQERQYVAGLLQAGRIADIREELNFGLQDSRSPSLGLEVSRKRFAAARFGRSVSSVNTLDMMEFEGSPVRPTGGTVQIAGGDVEASHIDVKNDSTRTVRSIEVGWIVRDERGKQYLAGSIPIALQLKPVETGTLSEAANMHFFQPAGQPLTIGSLTAFVSDVEFANGEHWIPSRADIVAATKKNPSLRRALADSPEQQRLAAIYRRNGINGLATELKRTD